MAPSGDNSRCIVLVPVGHHIEPPCDAALRVLEQRGYIVRRVWGYAAIDQCRSQLATDALAEGFEELMWIDADVGFEPDAVDALRRHDLSVVAGIYAKKGQRAIAVQTEPGTQSLTFGTGGGLVELRYAATGFVLTRREVYQRVQEHEQLPTCNLAFNKPTVPYFLPMLLSTDKGPWYLGEDYAFFERVRRSGIKVMADTSIRLHHYGRYGYTWEDAGSDRPHFATYHLHMPR